MRTTIAATALVAGCLLAGCDGSGPRTTISQRDRHFIPAVATVREGETLAIVNDDGDMRHHVYIDDPRLRYDSGDQEPGASAHVTFRRAGSYTLLCGIHPKMHLDVEVTR